MRGGLLGEKPVAELTHQDVYAFLEHMESGPATAETQEEAEGSQAHDMGTRFPAELPTGSDAAFQLAATGKVIAENSLAKIEKPGAASRVAESLLGTNATEIEAITRPDTRRLPPPLEAVLAGAEGHGGTAE